MITMEPLDKHDRDCLMTIKEFIEGIKCGGLTDWDGDGYFANLTHKSDCAVECSLPFWNPDKTLFTHVVWYNK